MPKAPDVYDRLKSTQIEGLTITQLNAATKDSFIEHNNVQFWGQAITLDRALESSRTYSHGLEIPEGGYVNSQTVDSSSVASYQPTGSEIFRIQAISVTGASGTPSVSIALTDGTSMALMKTEDATTTTTSFMPMGAPFDITNSLYLRVINHDGSINVTVQVAYQKMSL